MKTKKRRILAIILVAVSLLSSLSISVYAVDYSNGYVMLDIPEVKIQTCGNQVSSGNTKACQAYCLTYCRIILDNKDYNWTKYRNGNSGQSACAYSVAGYDELTSAWSEQEILQIIYDNINLGRPIILAVYGSTSFHYVVGIGYKKDCDQHNLKQTDFIVLDPYDGAQKSLYSSYSAKGTGLKQIGPNGIDIGAYRYAATHTGGTRVVGLCNHTYKTVQKSDGTYTAICTKCNEEYKITEIPVNMESYKANTKVSLCSAPYQDAKTGNYTTINRNYVIAAYAKNAYGNKWYKTLIGSEEYWIYEDYLDVKESISFNGLTTPGTLKKGDGAHISGTITSSNSEINYIKAEVIDSKTNRPALPAAEDQNINKTTYNINGSTIDWGLTFGKLPVGTYYIQYTARTKNGTESTKNTSTFQVVSNSGAQTGSTTPPSTTPTVTTPAVTKPTYYTVTYDANGGSVSPTSMRFTAGDDIDNMPTPTRSGYTFTGWSPVKNPTGSAVYIVAPRAMTVDEDMTLYAQWKADAPATTETWGPWSEWSIVQWASSPTRQVEKKETKISDAYTEYRYGRYLDSTGQHDCWCEKYLRSLGYAAVGLYHSEWSTTRYPIIDTGWTCGYCGGHHIGAASTSGGKSYWNEYGLPDGSYYWEESRTIPANVQTLYRYRDLQ